jgi:predicted nucleic acid-binding protein
LTYLLDTNVVSELRKIGDGKADASVVAWVGREDSASFFISAITILELERGILGVQRRDARQGARLRTWLDNYVRPEFAGRIYPSTMPSRHGAPISISPTGAMKAML